MTSCVCGSGLPFDRCCGPLLSGLRPAPTAEALMRSRYTAYTRGEMDYLLSTHDPETRADFDRAGSERWAVESQWMGLRILATERGGEDDDTGVVEFVARFRTGGAFGREDLHHERSLFVRRGGRWYYADAETRAPAVEAPKAGRNAPCPCGSGQKYKRCHGR